MAQGTVKWFNADKGYGFIAADDGSQDVFVHFADIEADGYRSLEENERVEYSVEKGARGLQARHVRSISGGYAPAPAEQPFRAEPSVEVPLPGAPLEAGDPGLIGEYTILRRLGQGAMGTVYLAHGHDGERVALKVVRAEWAHDEKFLRRFSQEAKHATLVDATYTAKVLAVSANAGPPYMATEFIDGPSLEDEVDLEGPLSPSRAKGVAVGTAAALIAIHAAGIIHRDFKPSNVMLSHFGPRVIDFGIARSLGSTTRLTQVGIKVGAPAYMSPEQWEDAELTPATDVFSWASTMIYAATGHQAFGGPDTPFIVLYRQILEGQPNFSEVPADLREILEIAFAKDPTARPTARHLLSLLTEIH